MPRYDLKNVLTHQVVHINHAVVHCFNLVLETDEIKDGVMNLWSSTKLLSCYLCASIVVLVVVVVRVCYRTFQCICGDL